MEENIEVELKLQVLNESQIKAFLQNLKFINARRIVDTYLDTKEGDLYKKGVFIRIRDNKRLEFKFNLADFQNQDKLSWHEQCDEFSFLLPLSSDSIGPINKICRILDFEEISNPNLQDLKTKNNLIDSFVIDKLRQRFTDGKFDFSLDEVKELGKFIEIELLASKEDNLEKIKQEMKEKLKDLRLKLITTGYAEVYWRKYNFDLYLQGRYLFKEDYRRYRPTSKI